MGDQTKATNPDGGGQADDGDGRADINGALRRYRRLGAACEIVVVAALPLCVLMLGSGLPWWLAALSIVAVLAAAAAAYGRAVSYAGMYARGLADAERKRAAEAAEREKALRARESKTTYRVTKGRLRTLEEVGVPRDVLDALATLIEHGPMRKDDLLRGLARDPTTDLGWERASEFAEKILKYTKHDAESGGGEGVTTEGVRGADARPEGTRGAVPEAVATAGSAHASAGVGV